MKAVNVAKVKAKWSQRMIYEDRESGGKSAVKA